MSTRSAFTGQACSRAITEESDHLLRRQYVLQSGERVTRLDDLQDIDELHVVEVTATHRPDRLRPHATGCCV